MEFYIFANSEENALELAGNGADDEFESVAHARREFDPEGHRGKLFKVTVEEVGDLSASGS